MIWFEVSEIAGYSIFIDEEMFKLLKGEYEKSRFKEVKRNLEETVEYFMTPTRYLGFATEMWVISEENGTQVTLKKKQSWGGEPKFELVIKKGGELYIETYQEARGGYVSYSKFFYPANVRKPEGGFRTDGFIERLLK